MSNRIQGAVWEMDLEQGEKLVLLALADHADHEGNNVFPGKGLVAWKTGYSERQVARIMDKLEELRILVCVESRPGYSKKYRIDIDAAPRLEPRGPRAKRANPCHGVTPDTVSPLTPCRPHPRHSCVTPTPDIAMSPEPPLEPPSEPIPSFGGLPPALSTPRFLDAWEKWCDWVKTCGKPEKLGQHLEFFVELGETEAYRAVHYSLSRKWQTPFSPKGAHAGWQAPPWVEPTAAKPKPSSKSLPAGWHDAWDRFLATYPRRNGDRKVSKGMDKYQQILRSGVDPAAIQAGVERYAVWAEATGKSGTEHVQQITTWLNGQAWTEEFEVPAVPMPERGPSGAGGSFRDRLRQRSQVLGGAGQ